MGVVHPGAPRPWLYLISERRARALRRCTHPQLACEILINLRFSGFIIGSVICGHIYAVCYRIKQRNNASLLTSVSQSVSQSGSQGFPAYYTTD